MCCFSGPHYLIDFLDVSIKDIRETFGKKMLNVLGQITCDKQSIINEFGARLASSTVVYRATSCMPLPTQLHSGNEVSGPRISSPARLTCCCATQSTDVIHIVATLDHLSSHATIGGLCSIPRKNEVIGASNDLTYPR